MAFLSRLSPRRQCSKPARNIFLKRKTYSILRKDRAHKVATIRAPNLDLEREGTMFLGQPLLSPSDPSRLVLECKAIQGHIDPHRPSHTLAASSVLVHSLLRPIIVARIKPRTVRIPTMMLPEPYHPSHTVITRTHQEVATEIVTCLSSSHLDPKMAMGALKEAEVVVAGPAQLEIQDL